MVRYEEKDFQLAKEFCAIALGTDKFYRALPVKGDEEAFRVEGLIPVDFCGVEPCEITSWDEAIEKLTRVYQEYGSIADPTRRNYMFQQVGGFRKVCMWLSGAPIQFRELAAETMFVDENPIGAAFLQKKYDAMDAALAEAGYSGTMHEKLAAWKEARVVPKEDVERVLNELLAEGKKRCIEKGFADAADLDVKAIVVYGKPYNGYCDYFTRTIEISGETAYTYEQLKHLVCHEAFPGHMTHMAMRERRVKAGEMPADAGLVMTNTASSPTFEGIADTGMAFLDWDNTIDDKICRYLQEIQSICNINASHIMYCGGGKDAAREYLETYSLASPAQISSRLRYFGFFFRKAYMYSYWRGWEAVANKWESLAEDEREPFLDYLYNHMHSVDTVAQFGQN